MSVASRKSSRKWTEEEKNMFAIILADPDDDYAVKLERMALNKTANTELFGEISMLLEQRMEQPEFIIENRKLEN